MLRREILVALCTGAIAFGAYSPIGFSAYASLAIVTLCLLSLYYFKGLQQTDTIQPVFWSVVLIPLALVSVLPLANGRALAGSGTISFFLAIRSSLVFWHNRKLQSQKISDDQLEAIKAKLDELHQKVDGIDVGGGAASDPAHLEETIRIFIERLQQERIDFTNGKIVRNEEVRRILLNSLSKANREVDIISPWVSRYALDEDLVSRMESALKRNVRIRIIYGISGKSESEQERLSRSQETVSAICRRFEKYGDLFAVELDNTHEKLLLCDDSFMLVGSYNLLSFNGKYDEETRKEMMYYFENPQLIKATRKRCFHF
jgi:hypothetical protein